MEKKLNYKIRRYKSIYKATTNYLYISSALKDISNQSGVEITSFDRTYQRNEIFSFISNLSRRTSKEKLPTRFEIIGGVGGEPTQARIIIRCPGDWTGDRFHTVGLQEWEKCRVADVVYTSFVARSVDMDLDFLDTDWKGPSRAA